MTVFSEYARYYDLLYRDKDYAGEAHYVDRAIQTHAPGASTLLNLGCGSGRHDREFAALGYQVTGVDLSLEMLACARQQAGGDSRLAYHYGDLRTIRLEERFDAVVALFHVMSYQTTNDDLAAAFRTAREHLGPGGIFLFDFWYGPGVLTDPPAVRVKELEDDVVQVTRIAQPVLHPNENVVDVHFRAFVRDKKTNEMSELNETHRMRYLFLPEIKAYAQAAGFEEVSFFREFSHQVPDLTSWAITGCIRVPHD